MLIALNNERPDRLPCQVHGWMDYYLKTYLNDMNWWQAYDHFNMDFAIYKSPEYQYDEKELANWVSKRKYLEIDEQGYHSWRETIYTPEGELHHSVKYNDITPWTIEYLIKTEKDFEIWHKYYPIPNGIDFKEIQQVKEQLGDRGIIRSHPFSPGQGSPWQSFCTLYDTEKAILACLENPEFIHYALESIISKTLRVTEMWENIPSDMVEIGGGAGSSTVISPDIFEKFCLPYDQRQVKLLHDAGLKIVYHLCGGLMPMLDLVIETGTDGLETMTPPSMGGDCDLTKTSKLIGDKLFFIGGFDQNAGFENGTPEIASELVFDCFEATKDHAGYILCPSDHFFHGNPANLQTFADAAKECVY